MAVRRRRRNPARRPIKSCFAHGPPAQKQTAASRQRADGYAFNPERLGSVDANVSVVPQALDFVLYLQLSPFQFHDSQIIDRGVGQTFVDFVFQGPVLFFQFRKVRLHRHLRCLLNPWILPNS
jgi:hypothetical protein